MRPIIHRVRRAVFAFALLTIASCTTDAVVTARAVDGDAQTQALGAPTPSPATDEPSTRGTRPAKAAEITPAPASTPLPPPSATPIPTPSLPEPQLGGFINAGVDDSWRPPPFDDLDAEAWPNNLRFLFDGIGTHAAGVYPFGSDVEPVVELISDSLGIRPRHSGARYEWGEPWPVVQIWEHDGRLIGFEVDLTQWSFAPVFVGDAWLMTESFNHVDSIVDAFQLIPVAYDDQSRLVRCSTLTTCLHQPLTLRPTNGPTDQVPYLRPYGLGPVEVYSSGWFSVRDLVATNYARSLDDSPIKVYRNPTRENDPIVEVASDGASNVATLGQPIESSDGSLWLRVLIPGHPLVPGFVDASAVSLSPSASDAEGALPRVQRRPDHLAALIGLAHSDPIDDWREPLPGGLFSQLGDNVDEGHALSTIGPNFTLRFAEFEVNGRDRVFTLSEPTEDGQFVIVEIWEMNAALGQAIANASTGRCPFLEGGDDANLAKIVVDAEFRPVAGWIWLGFDYQPVDVSAVTCDG